MPALLIRTKSAPGARHVTFEPPGCTLVRLLQLCKWPERLETSQSRLSLFASDAAAEDKNKRMRDRNDEWIVFVFKFVSSLLRGICSRLSRAKNEFIWAAGETQKETWQIRETRSRSKFYSINLTDVDDLPWHQWHISNIFTQPTRLCDFFCVCVCVFILRWFFQMCLSCNWKQIMISSCNLRSYRENRNKVCAVFAKSPVFKSDAAAGHKSNQVNDGTDLVNCALSSSSQPNGVCVTSCSRRADDATGRASLQSCAHNDYSQITLHLPDRQHRLWLLPNSLKKQGHLR